MIHLKTIIKFFFIVLIITSAIFSRWPNIEETKAAAKTFYFHSETSPLAGNWLLKEAAPELIADNSTRTSTSATNDTSILFKPDVSNSTATIGHGSTATQGFGWWSDTALNGTFDAGSWTFTIRNEDNRDSITSHFDINVFKVPQNNSVSGATLLFQHIGTVDFWTNSIKTTTETTAAVGPFTFTNEYLLIEIWDHTSANPSSGRVSRIHTEGSDLAAIDQSRVTTPNFSLTAGIITVGSSGTQTASLTFPSQNKYLGGAFTFVRSSDSANVTKIILKDTGTVNANTDLTNVKLFYKVEGTCSSSIPAGTSVFNAAGASFNASEKVTITGSMPVGTSQVCLYVQASIGSGATANQTIEIEITNPSTDVTVSTGTVSPGTVKAISGTTTLSAGAGAGGASSTLSLQVADPTKNPTLFYLSGGGLYMQEGAGTAIALTSSEVTVTSLQFTNVSYANTPGAVRIAMTLKSTNPQNRQEYEFEKTFYGTATIRKK